jgi:hypothetical protein
MSDSVRGTCSIQNCPAPATTSETGEVAGHWYVTIFYCDEHAREMREGTPLGPTGIDPAKLRIEPVGRRIPSMQPGRFPGID